MDEQRLRVVAILALALGGCADPPTDGPPAFQARDSAGIRLVDADWGQMGARLDTIELTTPTTRIGVAEGDPQFEFDRIVTVFPLGGGRLAVADGGSLSIRVFDENGIFVTAFGRAGEGPGEFRRISDAFEYRGDSIAVFEGRGRSVTIFDVQGDALRAFTPRPDDESLGLVTVAGALSDGRFVVVQSRTPGGATGLTRRESTLLLFDDAGVQLSVLDSFLGSESFAYQAEGFAASLPRPFPLNTFVAAFPDGIVLGDSDTGGFTARDASGGLRLRWRSNASRATVPNSPPGGAPGLALGEQPDATRDGRAVGRWHPSDPLSRLDPHVWRHAGRRGRRPLVSPREA